MGSFRQALKLLKEGRVVGIFPEGTRNRGGELLPANAGAAYLAITSGAPVVPVAISCSYRLFSRAIIKIGEPIDVQQYRQNRRRRGGDSANIANEVIMGRIKALLASSKGEVKGG